MSDVLQWQNIDKKPVPRSFSHARTLRSSRQHGLAGHTWDSCGRSEDQSCVLQPDEPLMGSPGVWGVDDRVEGDWWASACPRFIQTEARLWELEKHRWRLPQHHSWKLERNLMVVIVSLGWPGWGSRGPTVRTEGTGQDLCLLVHLHKTFSDTGSMSGMASAQITVTSRLDGRSGHLHVGELGRPYTAEHWGCVSHLWTLLQEECVYWPQRCTALFQPWNIQVLQHAQQIWGHSLYIRQFVI